jgi:callose synthase
MKLKHSSNFLFVQMTVLTIYAFLYGKVYLALSGVEASLETAGNILNNAALQTALQGQFLFQIGVFTAVPMFMNFLLEQGVFTAVISFCTMQLQLSSVFFTFSLGTRTHYFGRTILHGGAKVSPDYSFGAWRELTDIDKKCVVACT